MFPFVAYRAVLGGPSALAKPGPVLSCPTDASIILRWCAWWDFFYQFQWIATDYNSVCKFIGSGLQLTTTRERSTTE